MPSWQLIYKNTRQLGFAASVMVLPGFARWPSAASSAGGSRQRSSSLFVRHLPVSGRLADHFCRRCALGRTLRSNRRVVARRPTAFLRATRPATWRGWRKPLVRRRPSFLPRGLLLQRRWNKRPPAMSRRISPNGGNAVASSICRHKSPATLRYDKPLRLLSRQPERCVPRSLRKL